MNINPSRAGLGIRAELFDDVLNEKPNVGFLEAHSENYFGNSIARIKLLELRDDYPISLHGVGLSLGRADHLDTQHLKHLKMLVDEVEPVLVSEHLAWSAYSHTHLPDLLPLPLTEQALSIICQHIEEMQEALGRQILLENPSNYLLFDQLQIPEPIFLNTIAQRTGCGLLLDVNNVVVSANNLQRNPVDYIEQIESRFIGQYHLAGYTPVEKNGENFLIDTHNHTVYPEVWQLFNQTVDKHGVRPTLFEWDSDFPEFCVLLEECHKATEILSSHNVLASDESSSKIAVHEQQGETIEREITLAQLQQNFLKEILTIDSSTSFAVETHQSRLWIYQNNVYAATLDYLSGVFPAVCGVLGTGYFKQVARLFIKKNPPEKGNIHYYGDSFAIIAKQHRELQKMPYMADLIAYEWALHSAYYASNDQLLDTTKISQETLLTTSICFNESVHIIPSMFPIYEIHRQSLPDYAAKVAIDLQASKDTILVYKQAQHVVTKVLDRDESVFLQAIEDTDNLLQAIEAVDGSIEPETISNILSFIFENGLLMLNQSNDNNDLQSEGVA